MTHPAAGWYPDPRNPIHMRYWDGTAWTDLVQPNSLAGTPVPPPKSKKKNGWLQYLLLGIIILIVGIVVSSLTETTGTSRESRAPVAMDAGKDPTLLDPATYEAITEREFAIILKNPREHTGRRIILHGTVRQFDTATGPNSFLAEVGATPPAGRFDNTESALIIGAPATLERFVAKDKVTMHVLVDGQMTYTSAAKIEITVPQFQVGIIQFAD